ncbi:pirin family protein [Patiriisocius hiemis]|uniref:Pirin family protein n=1 Tax=Patiriisocius hiemis TaxID=3075604 RepID=A0ABU2Y887_9FLAO|nr:pirin family protein [Constantimarinum sp. W242]MDT0554405.1 pirin family protein [Constantimarinum sp. W242]
MKKILHPASTRGTADYGWLQANYSFSFANYFDPNRMQFGKLRVLNDDYVAPAMGFGKHPHQNMEIITIPQSGALKHKDSMGNEGVIKSGDIQIMSAGSGVEHSEVNASTTKAVKLFQIWILPEEQNVSPRYEQKEIDPLLVTNELTTIVKPKEKATEGDMWINQQAYFSLGNFDTKKDSSYQLNNKNHGTYFFVINGTVSIDNETLNNRDALGIWETEEIEFSAEPNTKLLVIEVPMN